jgi:hypothetical protein
MVRVDDSGTGIPVSALELVDDEAVTVASETLTADQLEKSAATASSSRL